MRGERHRTADPLKDAMPDQEIPVLRGEPGPPIEHPLDKVLEIVRRVGERRDTDDLIRPPVGEEEVVKVRFMHLIEFLELLRVIRVSKTHDLAPEPFQAFVYHADVTVDDMVYTVCLQDLSDER